MDPAAERRTKLRLVVGPDVTIQFSVKQIPYRNVRITNLSEGGCFATLPRAQNRDRLFSRGTLLEAFRFENADLASEPIIAKVAYVLDGGTPGRSGLELVGLGLHFGSLPPHLEDLLRRFIAQRT